MEQAPPLLVEVRHDNAGPDGLGARLKLSPVSIILERLCRLGSGPELEQLKLGSGSNHANAVSFDGTTQRQPAFVLIHSCNEA